MGLENYCFFGMFACFFLNFAVWGGGGGGGDLQFGERVC